MCTWLLCGDEDGASTGCRLPASCGGRSISDMPLSAAAASPPPAASASPTSSASSWPSPPPSPPPSLADASLTCGSTEVAGEWPHSGLARPARTEGLPGLDGQEGTRSSSAPVVVK